WRTPAGAAGAAHDPMTLYRLVSHGAMLSGALNHSPVSKREVLVAITAAFSVLSLGVAAWLQHPGSQHWLADLSQATRADSDQPREADRKSPPQAVGLEPRRCGGLAEA